MHIPACGRQAKYIGYTPELEGYANLFVYTTLGEMRANLRKIMNSKIKILIGILKGFPILGNKAVLCDALLPK